MVRNENETASTPGTNPEAANASFTVMLLNVRSVNNKAAALNDYFVDHNPDLICLTETWITEDTPNAVLRTLVPETFELHHCPIDQRPREVEVLAYCASKASDLQPPNRPETTYTPSLNSG
jgi:hypothetical protein